MKLPRARDPVVSPDEEDPLLSPQRADRGARIAWLILLLSLSATLLGWFNTRRDIEAAATERFQDCISELVAIIDNAVTTREAILRGGKALFRASDRVSAGEWNDFVRSLRLAREFPDVLGFGYAPEVPAPDLARLSALADDAGLSDFRVFPETDASTHVPVFYHLPSAGSTPPLIGFDLASVPAIMDGLATARDRNAPALTVPLTLASQGGAAPAESFMVLPVFAGAEPEAGSESPPRRVVGYVFLRLLPDKLIEDVLGNRLQEFEVQVFYGDPAAQNLVYDSHRAYERPTGHVPYLSASLAMQAAGQSWTLRFSSLPRFEYGLRLHAERYILVAGAAISLLLFAITRSLAATRTRALAIAQRMTRALREERTRLAEIAATLGEGLYVQDSHGIITYANPAAEGLLGWGADQLVGKASFDIFTEIRSDGAVGTHRHAVERSAMNIGRYAPEETRFRRQDGELLPVSVVSTPILRNSVVAGSVVAFQDIRERKRAEAALRESQQFEALFQYSTDLLFLMDLDGMIIDVNKVALDVLGYTREELVGFPSTRASRWATLPQAGQTTREFFDTLVQTQPLRGEAEFVRKDRSTFIVEIAFSPIVHERRKIILLAAHDITARKEAERRIQRALDELERSRREVEEINRRLAESNRELQRLSRRDGLTGIANRRHFDEFLEMEWQRAARDSQPLSLLIADVDHFKAYNDHYGHQAGDECLRGVAHTLDRNLSRSIDMVARYGGEEFVVVLPETPLQGAVKMADRLRIAVEEMGIDHARSDVAPHVTISVGVATMVPKPDQSAQSLISAADGALYQAKQSGRNRACAVTTES